MAFHFVICDKALVHVKNKNDEGFRKNALGKL